MPARRASPGRRPHERKILFRFAGDTQLTIHSERGKANIYAVDKGNNVENTNEGKNPDFQLPDRLGLEDPSWTVELAQHVSKRRVCSACE
jgi:hypothetical protein